MSLWWCEGAWLGGDQVTPDVLLEVSDGRLVGCTPGAEPHPEATVLNGLTLPGLANAHSHAFHRALRSRTQTGTGSFWTWRDQMYAVAQRLNPENYERLARAAFAEMALAGISVVGEFHYVHHQPDGTPYLDPNAMGQAVINAAAAAGVRLTLLDTCYLHGGLDQNGYQPVADHQRRFSDGTAQNWVERVGALPESAMVRIGAAVHSVRAVDPAAMSTVATWAHQSGAPVHAHVSEQPAEDQASQAFHGATPLAVLDAAGLVTAQFTAVHGTHFGSADQALLGQAHAGCCFCPTTERDLADGIGPAKNLLAAGATLSLGTDSQAVIDLFEEARAIELNERLATNQRGHHTAAELLTAATANGYHALGWSDGGCLALGGRADFVTVALDSVRTAGGGMNLENVVYAATAADVTNLVVNGQTVVANGTHAKINVAAELAAATHEVTS